MISMPEDGIKPQIDYKIEDLPEIKENPVPIGLKMLKILKQRDFVYFCLPQDREDGIYAQATIINIKEEMVNLHLEEDYQGTEVHEAGEEISVHYGSVLVRNDMVLFAGDLAEVGINLA